MERSVSATAKRAQAPYSYRQNAAVPNLQAWFLA
jgi:hypothetical protein